jgi:hypothetical protein
VSIDRAPRTPGIGRRLTKTAVRTGNLERRRYPSDWIYVGATDAPTFENSWSNAGGGLRQLRYRDSGFNSVDIEGAVTGGTAPSIVTTIDATMPLPDESQPIPGTGGHDWQLDPDGSLWVLT